MAPVTKGKKLNTAELRSLGCNKNYIHSDLLDIEDTEVSPLSTEEG